MKSLDERAERDWSPLTGISGALRVVKRQNTF